MIRRMPGTETRKQVKGIQMFVRRIIHHRESLLLQKPLLVKVEALQVEAPKVAALQVEALQVEAPKVAALKVGNQLLGTQVVAALEKAEISWQHGQFVKL